MQVSFYIFCLVSLKKEGELYVFKDSFRHLVRIPKVARKKTKEGD